MKVPVELSIKCLLNLCLAALLCSCASLEKDWRLARSTDTRESYQRFLEKHSTSGSFRVREAQERIEALVWPPQAPATAAGKKPSSKKGYVRYDLKGPSSYVVGECYLFADKARTQPLSCHPMFNSGTVVVPENLFAIGKAHQCYGDAMYEVVYLDQDSTLIRLDRVKYHKLSFGRSPKPPRGVFSLFTGMEVKGESVLGQDPTSPAYQCAGSVVTYGSRNYVLQPDGWYLTTRNGSGHVADKRLFAFSE